MNPDQSAPPPRGLLLDIEGTTTPIEFVHRVLFPYARQRAATFLQSHRREPSVQAVVEMLWVDLRAELSAMAADENELLAYIDQAMREDRKTTALKMLQGLIWQEGYRSGELHGEVFADVPRALERWYQAGIDTRIFSSGSVLAQQLLFATVPTGDLTPYLRGYFDTQTGAKADPASYGRIAAAFGLPPASIMFISDVVNELDAARTAGLSTGLAVRPGNAAQPAGLGHMSIHDFDSLGL